MNCYTATCSFTVGCDSKLEIRGSHSGDDKKNRVFCVVTMWRTGKWDTEGERNMFLRTVAVYHPTGLCSFETSLCTSRHDCCFETLLSTSRHDYVLSKRRYQPTRLCFFETSLSTSRHDYAPSKSRSLPADTTMLLRNVAVYQSHHTARKTAWCRFAMIRISLNTHKSLPKYFR